MSVCLCLLKSQVTRVQQHQNRIQNNWQHRHRCVDIRVVLNYIAATVPTMDEDKDDSNDSQDGGGVYFLGGITWCNVTYRKHVAVHCGCSISVAE